MCRRNEPGGGGDGNEPECRITSRACRRNDTGLLLTIRKNDL